MSARVWTMTLALSLSIVGPAAAQPNAREIMLFSITKSENRNRVVYVLDVDERCVPVAGAPLRAYWRMFEKGPEITEPLLAREERAYGLARQSVRGDTVRAALNALPARELTVLAWRSGETCLAAAWTHISGLRARLIDVHVVLTWPFGVDHLVVRGITRDGQAVEEIVEP